MQIRTCNSKYVKVRGQFLRVRSLLPPTGCWGLNSGGQAWPKVFRLVGKRLYLQSHLILSPSLSLSTLWFSEEVCSSVLLPIVAA